MVETLRHRFNRIERSIDEINTIASTYSKGKIVALTPISIKKPDFSIPIHGFYTMISWLYVVYYECGKPTIDFLAERSHSLGFDLAYSIPNHLYVIHSFRTYLQHNLNFKRKDDLALEHCCHNYIIECLHNNGNADFRWPTLPEHWIKLLECITEEASVCFSILQKTLQTISNDDSGQDNLEIWMSRIKRNHAPYEYDDIIEAVIHDFGLKYIDPVKLRNKYFQQWNQKISLFRGDYNFNDEARLLVEHTILNEEELPAPVSGKDLIEYFKISPGIEVKRLKEKAQKLYNKKPRSKNDLLKAL